MKNNWRATYKENMCPSEEWGGVQCKEWNSYLDEVNVFFRLALTALKTLDLIRCRAADAGSVGVLRADSTVGGALGADSTAGGALGADGAADASCIMAKKFDP
jgi:hypothetical protein